MKKLYFLCLTFLMASVSFGQVVINEIDADTPGSDTAEFVELKAAPNASLDGFIVVFFNGGTDVSYGTWDLTGQTADADGFFILGNDAVTSDIELPAGGSGYVQNGADAIAIYQDSAANFPDGTAPTTTNLIDAIVYGTGDADDMDLLTALGESTQWDESLNGANATESLQLNAAGDAYETKAPTFRAENDSAVCDLSLTSSDATCDAFTAGTDTYTATVDFSGGNSGSYTVTADSGTVDLSMGDPSTDETGTITVTGVAEGTDVIISVTDGGLCDLSMTVTTPACNDTLTLPISETFSYADGSLLGNSSWTNHSGTEGDLMVVSGQAVVQHGAPSEDINLPFQPVTGSLFFAFDMTVQNPGAPIAGTDNEYFAHFKDDGFGFFGRLDIVAPSGGGDYTVGIATANSTAEATWATDLTYGSTYRITVKYDQDANIAQLWVDAALETDTSISGTDGDDPGNSIESFALRQSDSADNEGILVDNLRITQTFAETLSTQEVTADTFKVYPNPTATGFVNIVSANNENVAVTVYDILGKQVINETLTNNRVNVSALNTGVYILKISQNNASVTKKLVIK
ncbi:T9SS type A sorting domain-containing protein [Psychroserpens sp. SPM9]|uniref:T9SS type A sorting domain-containing protein n=1 Tax=Psychroserpens sp. SPM9 TaxID=2975598 RepID=UPI0021A3CD1F|nr:T9SS type A sorting domain-containing protein [Psychroserpens sp. SPM9]MDG5490371.1 T9SS type A sorting domain-containing protein [Psychroserpens sp. SPM9]